MKNSVYVLVYRVIGQKLFITETFTEREKAFDRRRAIKSLGLVYSAIVRKDPK